MLEIIKLIDIKSWVGLIGVLFGAMLGLSGVIFANRSSFQRLKLQLDTEKERAHAQVKREKLEELYVLLSQWENMFFSNCLNLTLVMKGEIDYNQYLDEIIESGQASNVDFHRLEMIINIYARELFPLYKDVLKCRDKINKISMSHKQDYMLGKFNGEEYLDIYLEAHTELNIKVKKLQEQLAELATNA
ncbi:hypothetical protein [Photobacterium leiognathi]|uniref:hypothetical protein n=1 Tax=Photobacterium leiognathi TaxID=553611 RepID=UPI0029816830|nr:hypothetical protein [Photobacterium leiognathi]